MRSVVCVALCTTFLATSAAAEYRITGDTGGQIGPYIERLAQIRESGQRVVIDGPCLSACTLVLGVIPAERICVTRRARLGFHAAWHHGQNGRPETNRGGTQLLMAVYPPRIKTWIAKRGGLNRKMRYLSGRELTSMYPLCT